MEVNMASKHQNWTCSERFRSGPAASVECHIEETNESLCPLHDSLTSHRMVRPMTCFHSGGFLQLRMLSTVLCLASMVVSRAMRQKNPPLSHLSLSFH